MLQRRQRHAHIASPSPPLHPLDAPSPSSLLNRRATRTLLFLLAILALFTLTHYLPTTQSQSYSYNSADLHPKNYFNTSTDVNPFEFCPTYGAGDKLTAKYGMSVLSKSRMHLGTGTRIQRVMERALAGKPVTISVIGGSVSACHGAGNDPISPKCYPSKFFKWWNSVFPHPATELTNGAMRRTNSDYFGFCAGHHIPDVTDLVIIELDTDDSPNQESTDNFEILVRSLLLRPDSPAVVLLGHFSPQIHQTHGFAAPDHWHDLVAQFYDVPHLSTKAVLFPDYMRDPASVTKYYEDPVLANDKGHDVLADILIAYMQSQICTTWDMVARGDSPTGDSPQGDSKGLFGGVGPRKGVPAGVVKDEEEQRDTDEHGNRIKPAPDMGINVEDLGIPLGRINTRPLPGTKYEEIAPYCVSANDLINPLPPSLFFGSGWYVYHTNVASSANAGVLGHYFHTSLPTSRLRVPITVGSGDIGVYYIVEPFSAGEESSVDCWVDDNYLGAKTLTNLRDIGEPRAELAIIDKFVTRGSHFVECTLNGEEGTGVTPPFKIIGIFAT